MLLDLSNEDIKMKLVYELSEELKSNLERISLTQALTLDISRPVMGLKGSLGLFGSSEWWNNIKNGVMPLLLITGTVRRAYVSGQDSSERNNMIDLILADGSACAVGIYVNNLNDVNLFEVGCKVKVIYALDELKCQPAADGSVNYSKIALEMAVSIIS